MQIATFRKNVMKTVDTKAAKLSLRLTGKNTLRANVAHAAVFLKADTGHLLQSLSHYVLGSQFNQEMKDYATTSLGDIGYDLIVLCRMLKVKMPTSTKKSKLVGTRTAALLLLDGITTDIMVQAGRGMFCGPKMTKVKKIVVLPNKGGAKEEREVSVVDIETEKAEEGERQETIKSLLHGALDVYWRLCFDLLQQPPAVAMADKFARMQTAYPHIEFDTAEEPEEVDVAEPVAPVEEVVVEKVVAKAAKAVKQKK